VAAESQTTTILVLEDHDDTRELFVMALTEAGYRCVAARDPDEALRHASTVDAVLMDLGLPRLTDGLALAWRLRGLSNAPPIVAVSGHPSHVEAVPAPLFRAWLQKPVDPAAIVETITRVVRADEVR
jgi:DNA-binding response OmpR family regulator